MGLYWDNGKITWKVGYKVPCGFLAQVHTERPWGILRNVPACMDSFENRSSFPSLVLAWA